MINSYAGRMPTPRAVAIAQWRLGADAYWAVVLDLALDVDQLDRVARSLVVQIGNDAEPDKHPRHDQQHQNR